MEPVASTSETLMSRNCGLKRKIIILSSSAFKLNSQLDTKIIRKLLGEIQNFHNNTSNQVVQSSVGIVQQSQAVCSVTSQRSDSIPNSLLLHTVEPLTAVTNVQSTALRHQDALKVNREIKIPVSSLIPIKNKFSNVSKRPAAIANKTEETVEEIILDETNTIYHSDKVFVSQSQKQHVIEPARKDYDLQTISSAAKSQAPATSLVSDSFDVDNSCAVKDSDIEFVLKVLPQNYDYKILSLNVVDNEFKHICCNFRVNVHDETGALKFKEDFEKSSKTNFRVKKTWGNLASSSRVIFKKKYRCHHDTLAAKSGSRKPHEKHISCPSTMVVTVKNKNMKWSKDDLLTTHPADVCLKAIHNHSVEGSDILRFRKPSPEIVEKFTKMFSQQYPSFTPTSAMDAHLADLEMEGNELSLLMGTGDGAQVPTMAWLYKLYNKFCKERCGDPYGEGMIVALQKYINEYNTNCGEICAKMGTACDGKQHYVAICTPLMKRVHTHLPSSAEMMFIDASGNMDGCNARVFNIFTHSVAGGLPLGILITFCEDETVITAAMDLWKTVIPDKAFYGRGVKGPKIVMTDDSKAERNSLQVCFPDAVLLLCIFHVLQAMWRYIWDSKHEVPFQEKSELYLIFHRILYAPNTEVFEELYSEAEKNELFLKNNIVKSHIIGLKDRANEWALSPIQDLLSRNNDTNNIVEASFRVLIDRILGRVKAFNPVELMYYLVTRLDSYYKSRLSFVISNRPDPKLRMKFRIAAEKLRPLRAEKILCSSSNLYEVTNIQKSTTVTKYVVDMDLEVCACPMGYRGAACKHQLCVVRTFGLSSHQFLPYNDISTRNLLAYIMTGHNNVPPGFFDTLKGGVIEAPESEELTSTTCEESILLPTGDVEGENHNPSSSADIQQNEPDDSSADDINTQLQNFAEDLAKRVCKSSDSLREPLNKFLQRYWSTVKNSNFESSLASGLATFLQEQKTSQTHLRRKKIRVQATALARRAEGAGGRHAQKGGRPRGTTGSKEHSYNNPPKNRRKNEDNTPSWACPPKKNAKVPHNLMRCVEANVMLPK
ncbi:putative transposase for insertion sequence element [Frankliniella fusca]|uniref:Transposase for insertion sequence element n=1 Tax=Frankliniella fusca TaxID=407009 RepID=A0AAE1GW54_9NEOP|nr:putative transposase for insertion sequence element [Frankliniella fusca]